MLLIRLSGHSGAGKSRLLAALAKNGVRFRRPIMYTSRPPRDGEVHGRDYFFMSRGFIQSLPPNRFLVGDVRQSVQALDLAQLEFDLRSGDAVIVEIFHTRWPPLKEQMHHLFGADLRTLSVFLTAVRPESFAGLPKALVKSRIRDEVAEILRWRGKDPPEEILDRAESAVTEIMEAVSTPNLYERIFSSSPEGPDGDDDWTRNQAPEGQAAEVLRQFVALVQDASH